MHADRLAPLALSDRDYADHVAARSSVTAPQTIDFVRVIDNSRVSERAIASRLLTQAGDPVDHERLAADASRLYALQLYEHVAYRIVEDGEQTGVEFVTTEKPWGPNILKFGMSLQDDLDGDTTFNVATRITRGALNSLGAEWRHRYSTGIRFGSCFPSFTNR